MELENVIIESFPLAPVTDNVLRDLCQQLWAWQFCEACNISNPCENAECPTGRMPSLSRYFDHYKGLVASYGHDLDPNREDGTISSHEELFEIIKQLKLQPNITRGQVTKKV